MSLRLITPPAAEPITLEEAKLQCRVDGTAEDTWFTSFAIPGARRAAEHELGRKLITQTWEAVFDAFPSFGIELGAPRVLSIVSIKYVDTTGAEQTLAAENYLLDADTLPGWALPLAGTSWPDTADAANVVTVRFTCGYGPAATDVPANVRQWMLMHIGTAYKNRESMVHGVSVAEIPNRYVDSLLDGERTWVL